jgi:hypothetical protein
VVAVRHAAVSEGAVVANPTEDFQQGTVARLAVLGTASTSGKTESRELFI